MKSRVYIKDLPDHLGEEVTLAGRVSARRDHGKLIFLDLRDETSHVQMVVLPMHDDAYKATKNVRDEWVLQVVGKVNKRPEKMVNSELENGNVEIEVLELTILNEAETPAFDVQGDGHEIGEEHRLKYRYLDLRRPRLQKNIRNRHRGIKYIRDFFDERGFVEIETPILTKSTPEGARDYVVPSRIERGKFYALPQSPQQYKQLLMASGFEKYFQIARCLRDEDTRGDRQPEHTQLDLEMAFTTEEEVMELTEKLLIDLVKKIRPDATIQDTPFPRILYKEAMEKYGSDRPDIRKDKDDENTLAFCFVVDFPFFEKNETGKWTFTHNPFSAAQPKYEKNLLEKKDVGEIIAAQYDIVLNGVEIGGGSIRNHKPELLSAVFSILGYDEERIQENFGHMLSALRSGAPPHGGIAWGLDRLFMILEKESSIREVIAFPKTGEGRDFLMQAPSEITREQLLELGIKTMKEK